VRLLRPNRKTYSTPSVVEKIATSRFSEVLKERIETDEWTKYLRKLKGGHLGSLGLKKFEIF